MDSIMKILEEAGIKVFDRSAIDVLFELSCKWKTLPQDDKDKILQQFN